MSARGDAVRLIDVIWLEKGARMAAAFEVEHSTSLHSGIVRMLDLAVGRVWASPVSFSLSRLTADEMRSNNSLQGLRSVVCPSWGSATCLMVSCSSTVMPLLALALESADHRDVAATVALWDRLIG